MGGGGVGGCGGGGFPSYLHLPYPIMGSTEMESIQFYSPDLNNKSIFISRFAYTSIPCTRPRESCSSPAAGADVRHWENLGTHATPSLNMGPQSGFPQIFFTPKFKDLLQTFKDPNDRN